MATAAVYSNILTLLTAFLHEKQSLTMPNFSKSTITIQQYKDCFLQAFSHRQLEEMRIKSNDKKFLDCHSYCVANFLEYICIPSLNTIKIKAIRLNIQK